MSRPQEDPDADCEFCGQSEGVELHHVVPHRYGGSNSNENLIPVCGHCHKVLERTYNKRFFERIGSRVGMTPNMMLDHIRELEALLQNAISSVNTQIQIYEMKLGVFDGQQKLPNTQETKRARVKIEALNELTEGVGMAPKFPEQDDFDELRSYREYIEEGFESEDRPRRRGESYSNGGE